MIELPLRRHRPAAYLQRRHAKDKEAEELTEEVENPKRQLADRDAEIAELRCQVLTLVAQRATNAVNERNCVALLMNTPPHIGMPAD